MNYVDAFSGEAARWGISCVVLAQRLLTQQRQKARVLGLAAG